MWGRTVRLGGSVIGRRQLDSVGGTECLRLIEDVHEELVERCWGDVPLRSSRHLS
jgi:hypothetical protein